MSGCCGPSPVVIQAPAPSRVDVETLLLCDVLADGTVAATVLVEPVYDTISGDRVGTRTVDPVTGAAYTPQGTIQPCVPPEQCSCETLLLCDLTPGGPMPTAGATVTVTATTPGANGVPGSVMGGPVNAPVSASQTVWDGSAAVMPASADNEHTYLTGRVAVVPDCGDLDPAGTTVLNLGVRIHNEGIGAGCGLWGRFTVWVNGVDVVGPPASNLGTFLAGTGIAPGTTVNPTRTATVSNADLLAGNVYVELNVQTGADTTGDGTNCTPNDPGVGQSYTVDQFTITAEPVAVTDCLATEGEPVPFLRHLCRTCTGTATVTDTTLDGATAYVVQGEVGQCSTSEDCDQFTGTLCYQEPTTQDPSFTLHKFTDADPNHPGCLVGLDSLDGDFPFIQYTDPITSWEGTYGSNTGTASNVEISAPELGGFIDWSAFSPAIPSVPNAGIPAPYTGTAVFNGITVTLDVFTAQALTTGTQYLRMGGTLHFRLSFSSPVTMKFGTQGFADPAPDNDERFCSVTATGVVTGAGEIRTAYGLRDCTTGETTWRDQVTGDVVDLAQAVAVPCQVQRDCASPTEPTATVGLCLADGTPIAVTVIRDCAGTVTSEGWLNLVTGAYSAGAPPAGTAACGDSRSIQVSGTFCAVDDTTGDVVALVLVEYSYDDTGAIEAVRLVDAVTGSTYTPSAGVTVTTCPTGTEQPEQDAVVLCDTATDGTVTEFLRDFRRDENGAITGHSDYLLDGTAYAPTGTVGVCSSPCLNCETIELCDITPGPIGWAMVKGSATPETLANGITVTWTRNIPAGGVVPDTNMRSWLPTAASLTSSLSTSKPAQVRIGVSLAHDQTLTLPPGAEVQSLSSHHTYNPATRVLTADATSTMSGDTSAGANAGDYITHIYLPRVADAVNFTASVPGGAVAFDNIEAAAADPYPFLRTVCRGCDGTITSTADTELDGTTVYTVVGEAGSCQPGSSLDCETLVLCDDGADDPALIGGNTSSGSLPNGVTWQARGSSAVQNPLKTNANGAWWNLGTFPNPSITSHTWTFNRPVEAEFSVVLYYSNATPTAASVQLPPNVEPVSLPAGYHYDAATRVLSADSTLTVCSDLNNPSPARSARFRTRDAVTSFTLLPLGVRIAACGQFGNWWFGAITVTPSGQFLRTICRGADGTVASVADTTLDGKTGYTPLGAVKVCAPPELPEPVPCCQPVQVCIQQDPIQQVEFISNEAHRNDNTVDPVWKWTTDLNAANPPWYDMYQYQYSGAWSVTDSDPARPAWWVSPHPFGASAQSSPARPNEGPSLLNAHWFPRAYFDLPDNADPGTIKVQATVFNADQVGRAFRLNNGAWQALPATATHNGATYTFGPDTIPGATAGRNYLYLDVEETVGGGAGLMVHLKVFYEVIPETRSWTRMVCCDDTVYYLDEDGQRQNAVPDGWHVAPCSGSTAESTGLETVLLCDVTTVTTPGETPERITNGHFATDTAGWTITGGAAYVPTGGPDGQVGVLDFSQNNQAAGKVEQATTVTPGLTYNLSARIGIWSTGGTTPQKVLVEVFDGSGAVLHSQTVAPVEVSGGPQWPADGVVGPVPIVATDTTMLVRFTDQVGGDFIDALLDDVSLLGPGVPPASEGQAVPFLRHYTVDPAGGTATYFDTTLDGAAYAPQGEVGVCAETSTPGSEEPTPAVVFTGARSTTGTAPVDLAAEFPGLQSVTLLVSTGSVLATLTNGAAVPIPAGSNVTWSVTRDQDTALDAASFTGADAGTTYLLLFTYTA
jgi:hypothetical protein